MATRHDNVINTLRLIPGVPIQYFGAPARQGGWAFTLGSPQRFTLQDQRGSDDSVPAFKSGTVQNSNVCFAWGMSQDPLAAQTITGNVEIIQAMYQAQVTSDYFWRVYIWVLAAGTQSTVRGVLLDWTSGTEMPPTSALGVSSGALALTPLAVQDGDRIVMEIGAVKANAFLHAARFYFSGGSLDDGTIVADLAAADTDVTFATTITFDAGVTFQQYTPDDGDVLVGNGWLLLYDGAAPGYPLRTISPPGTGAISGMVQRPNNGMVAIACDKGFTYDPSWLWEVDPTDLQFTASRLNCDTGINPHSIAELADGSLLTGFVGDDGTGCGERGDTGTPTPASYAVQRLNAADTIIDNYPVAPDLGGSQAIRLRPDAQTLVYTSLGRQIKQYDIVNDVQLADFATLPIEAEAIARGIALLPDGGLLVADRVNVKRLNAAGTVIQTYTIPALEPPIYLYGGAVVTYATYYGIFTGTYNSVPDFGVITLAPDGLTFWVANRADASITNPTNGMYATICQFELASGDCLALLTGTAVPDTGGSGCSGGIMAFGAEDVPTGTLIVEKITSPSGSAQEFEFSAPGQSPDTFTLQDGEQQVFADIPVGTYSVEETEPDGWTQTDVTVSNGSPVDAIEVGDGETVTVTFTNTENAPCPGTRGNAPTGA
jgi:hypothetical protein